jgi:hypothetical protein
MHEKETLVCHAEAELADSIKKKQILLPFRLEQQQLSST